MDHLSIFEREVVVRTSQQYHSTLYCALVDAYLLESHRKMNTTHRQNQESLRELKNNNFRPLPISHTHR
jgi:hypothetical protein